MSENKAQKRPSTHTRVYCETLDPIEELYATLILNGKAIPKQEIMDRAVKQYCRRRMKSLKRVGENVTEIQS